MTYSSCMGWLSPPLFFFIRYPSSLCNVLICKLFKMSATVLTLLFDQDIHGRHLKTHELSLKEKEFVKVAPRLSFPGVAVMTIFLMAGCLEAG